MPGRQAGSRNYRLAYKQQVVAETFEAGRSVASVARDHGLNANMVFGWRRDARFRPAGNDVGFLPVEVRAAPVSPPGLPSSDGTVGEIEIALASGHRLTVRGSFDGDALARVLKGLVSS